MTGFFALEFNKDKFDWFGELKLVAATQTGKESIEPKFVINNKEIYFLENEELFFWASNKVLYGVCSNQRSDVEKAIKQVHGEAEDDGLEKSRYYMRASSSLRLNSKDNCDVFLFARFGDLLNSRIKGFKSKEAVNLFATHAEPEFRIKSPVLKRKRIAGLLKDLGANTVCVGFLVGRGPDDVSFEICYPLLQPNPTMVLVDAAIGDLDVNAKRMVLKNAAKTTFVKSTNTAEAAAINRRYRAGAEISPYEWSRRQMFKPSNETALDKIFKRQLPNPASFSGEFLQTQSRICVSLIPESTRFFDEGEGTALYESMSRNSWVPVVNGFHYSLAQHDPTSLRSELSKAYSSEGFKVFADSDEPKENATSDLEATDKEDAAWGGKLVATQ